MKNDISRLEQYWLFLGAIGGFLIAFLSTRSLGTAVILGVPSGIFGVGIWLLFLRGVSLQTKKNYNNTDASNSEPARQ